MPKEVLSCAWIEEDYYPERVILHDVGVTWLNYQVIV